MLLGCTHFPIMEATLRRIVGRDVRIEDPSKRLSERLARMFPDATEASSADVHFHVTDSPEGFLRVANAMGFRVTNDIRHVDLTRLSHLRTPETGCV
jgi:glutamate racemase